MILLIIFMDHNALKTFRMINALNASRLNDIHNIFMN